MNYFNRKGTIFFAFIPLLVFSSCASLKDLKKDEYLLHKQSIKGHNKVSKSELDNFFRQQPNDRFLNLIPYYYFYNLGKVFYSKEKYQKKLQNTEEKYNRKIEKHQDDSARVTSLKIKKKKKIDKLQKKIEEGNWLMADIGSPPVIYDSALANQTVKQMHTYLHSKGFFNNKVTHDTTKKKRWFKKIFAPGKAAKRVISEYHIQEGTSYKIKEINYNIQDRYIKKIYNEYLDETLLHEGDIYNEQDLKDERSRIERLLKNNGYYDFSRQYINYKVDTTISKPHSITLKINILNPENQNRHKVYEISKVFFKYDVGVNRKKRVDYDTVSYKGIHFIYDESKYSKKILEHKTELEAGVKFSLEATQITRKRLTELGVFKFVEINYLKDSTNKLIAEISAYSMDRFRISDEFGLNVSQGLPGPFFNLSFTHRNVFQRFEIFDFNFNYGFEGVAAATDVQDVYRSQQLGGNASMTFPKLFFPFNVNYYFRNNNPKTRISSNYNGIIRPEYERNNLRFSMDYKLQKNHKHRYDLSLVNMNFLNTSRTEPAFEDYLDSLRQQGSRLFESFRSSYLSNITFSYRYNDYQMGQRTRGSYFELNSESGGTTLNFFDFHILEEALNRVGLESIFVYYKLSADYRYYLPGNNNDMFATRFKVGIANPYKSENDVLPYEKFFFAGGSNSIRAWQPRRLGPGAFRPLNDQGELDYSFEQPGEIILETSAEYRFDIISYLEGALFLDAGNVWVINDPVDTRKNFRWNKFYKQIAVGTGFGFRLDFSFLILRFDVGIKMWDPARPLSERYLGDELSFKKPFGGRNQTTINIGIGYPF